LFTGLLWDRLRQSPLSHGYFFELRHAADPEVAGRPQAARRERQRWGSLPKQRTNHMIRMTPARVGLLVFATALTFYWTLLNATGPGWVAWYRLASVGQAAVATITGIQPEIHQRCLFKFTVAGVEHHGQGDGCSPLGIGAALPVTYLPTDSTFVSTGNPGEELLFEILGPLGLAAVGGLGSAWRFSMWKRSRAT
jgi:hypothetical protein